MVAATVAAVVGLGIALNSFKNMVETAGVGNSNREIRNEQIADPETTYCPTTRNDEAVGNSIKNMSGDIFNAATITGTFGGGPAGTPTDEIEAVYELWRFWAQPEPEE